jgi:G:T-mismatch repair DNA endonuclease (very short patch repair protein)
VFCAGDYFIVFYVVRAVHKLGFRFIIRRKPNKRRPDAVLETYVFDMVYMFCVKLARKERAPVHAVKVKAVLVCTGQY